MLETIFVGGARCTSKEALQRLFADVTMAREGVPIAAPGAARRALVPVVLPEGDVDAVLRDAGISGGEEGA